MPHILDFPCLFDESLPIASMFQQGKIRLEIFASHARVAGDGVSSVPPSSQETAQLATQFRVVEEMASLDRDKPSACENVLLQEIGNWNFYYTLDYRMLVTFVWWTTGMASEVPTLPSKLHNPPQWYSRGRAREPPAGRLNLLHWMRNLTCANRWQLS